MAIKETLSEYCSQQCCTFYVYLTTPINTSTPKFSCGIQSTDINGRIGVWDFHFKDSSIWLSVIIQRKKQHFVIVEKLSLKCNNALQLPF